MGSNKLYLNGISGECSAKMALHSLILCSLNRDISIYFLHFVYFFLLQIEKSAYFCRFYAKKDNISYFYCNFAADITILHNNFKLRREIMEKDSRSSLFVS
jgi:hypothetical protein